ncbi:MAG TPA: T9SS type A sorting domain-containing protein, partial [Candidatus Absconditabacterales bacterium]|nr:T9SS type A sorting domain-containing protein [Candidatus Absconditabacterales bacterium]
TKCCVWVDIQDNNNLCTKNQIDSFTLTVCTNHWLCTKPIEGVDFGLLGKTDHTGCLKFKLPKGRINLKPSYDDGDHPNAVTTADIVLIQKHILGKDSLNPYQIIAADVNKSSGSITSADISEIRKLILGANSSFKHNDWVFVPDSLSLNLDRDTTIHFIGVKLGDVNGSWCSHNVGGLLERLSKKDVSLINKLYNQTLIYEQNLGFHDEQGSQVELIDDDSFQIIPNPNVGNFIVVSKKDQEFKLFSPQGVYLLNGKTNTELNWYLKPGLYVIQVLGSSTSRVKKMIVQ